MFRFRPPKQTNVIDIYDDHASSWWDFSNPIFEPLHAMVPARAAYLDRQQIDVSDKVVVDVGAGGGYVTGLLAKRGARVMGIDVARRALLAGQATLREYEQQLAFTEASALALPVADNSVDVVVNTDVMVHLPAAMGGVKQAIAEAARVLKPGGTFWFSTINDTWLARFVLITLGEDILGVIHKGTHEPSTFISPTTMTAMCDDVGLTLIANEGLGPVGVGRNDRGRLALKMGRQPTMAVMWQGHASKNL